MDRINLKETQKEINLIYSAQSICGYRTERKVFNTKKELSTYIQQISHLVRENVYKDLKVEIETKEIYDVNID